MTRHHSRVRSHPTVLLALDRFKGCLDAADVCAELSSGVLDPGLPVKLVLRPVADGATACWMKRWPRGSALVAATDVESPLTGSNAAAQAFGRSITTGLNGPA